MVQYFIARYVANYLGYFIISVGRLITARNFNDSFFILGEPNLILVPSGKILNMTNLVWMYI